MHRDHVEVVSTLTLDRFQALAYSQATPPLELAPTVYPSDIQEHQNGLTFHLDVILGGINRFI
jgi:hypothetical protein